MVLYSLVNKTIFPGLRMHNLEKTSLVPRLLEIRPGIHCSHMHKTWESVHVDVNQISFHEQCIPGRIFKRPGNEARKNWAGYSGTPLESK